MQEFRIASFTKWKQSDGTNYPYNVRKIKADTLQDALDAYKKKYRPNNRIGLMEEPS